MTALALWQPSERRAWAPPPDITVDEWADRYARLPPDAPIAGKLHVDTNPATRGPMRAFTDDRYDALAIMGGSQGGKSTIVRQCLSYVIGVAPGPTIFVLPRKDDVEDYPEEFVKPMILGTDQLRRHLSGRKRDWKTDHLRINGCSIWFASAQSPADLASRPRRYLFGDECDKWPHWAGKDADPLSLARERQKWYHNAKELLASTPTTRDGLIWKRWERSNQQRFWVPCVHCGRFQVLAWEQVTWDQSITDPDEMLTRKAAWYRCRHCEKRLEDSHKLTMMRAGQWVKLDGVVDEKGVLKEPESRHRTAGFHIWSGYNPIVSWSKVVAKFLEAGLDPAQMMNFVNGWLAEIWEEQIASPTRKALSDCFAPYKRDQVVDEVRWITGGGDVQGNDPGGRIYYALRGWGTDLRSWLVRCGWTTAWDELEALITGDWGGRRVNRFCIDARNREDEVLAFARKLPDIVTPVKGTKFGADSSDWGRPHRIDRHPVTGAPLKASLMSWHVNVNRVKDTLAALVSTGAAPGARAFHVHAEVQNDYLAHMTSEHKVRVRLRSDRRAVEELWVKKGQRANEWWDTETYALMAAKLIGLDHCTTETLRQQELEDAAAHGGGPARGGTKRRTFGFARRARGGRNA